MIQLLLFPITLCLMLWKTFNYINYKASGLPMLVLGSVGFYGYYQNRKEGGSAQHQLLTKGLQF